ncbi:MAG: hypothetical protein HeimC2_18490 [Candidatus Heimdallarchaeota archaeon LC_2]|nr:MAG: hypothetical protein HeimC2_18490 [Candidatus Heimdallarchaeota archaeon LC_2]
MKIEFLQILSKNGLPMYSKCYGNICGNFYENDVLLHRYLTSLKHTIDETNDSSPDKFNEITKVVKRLKSGVTVIFGVSDNLDSEKMTQEIDTVIKDINHTISLKWIDSNWKNLDEKSLAEFEEQVLQEVILPWFEKLHNSDNCPKGDNCYFRESLLPSLRSVVKIKFDEKIWKRMNDTYHYYRKRDEELVQG